MKRTVNRRYSITRYAYPNEADHNYQAQRIVDTVTALASGMGLIAAMLFLILLV